MDLKPSNISYLQATGDVKTSAGYVYSIILTGGSDAATLILKDNTTAKIVLAAAANSTVTFNTDHGLYFATSIKATITGTTPSITVGHR